MTAELEEQILAIRMGVRSAPAFAVVEGSTDKALLKRLLDASVVIVIAGGKDPLYKIAGRLDAYPSVFAVADQDYDLILGRAAPTNVFHWDHADAETTCILNGGLDYLVDSYCSPSKVEAFGLQTGISLEAALLNRLSVVGALRLVSARDALNLPFSSVSLGGFVNKKTLEIEIDRWALALLARAGLPAKEWSQLSSEISAIVGTYSAEELVRGHDLATLIAVGARSTLGSRKASVEELALDIEIAVRGTLRLPALKKSQVGQRITTLEAQLGVSILETS